MQRLKFLLLSFFAIVMTVITALALHSRERSAVQETMRHEISLTLHPETQNLEASDKLTVRSDRSPLNLTLNPAAQIKSVSYQSTHLPYTFNQGRLKISPPANQQEFEIEVTYQASFHDPVPANPMNTDDPSYGITGTISPAGVYLSSDAGWYPEIPGSHPTFLVRARAPEGMLAVTSGKHVGTTTEHGITTSTWETSSPLPGISLSAGHYVVNEADADGTPIFTYFYEENASLSNSYLKAVAGYLQLYRHRIGEYPFHKYAVVENFFPSGYGFPSYTLIGSTVLRLPFIIDTSLGHEVAHSWWGNSVLVDYSHGNWSEGLTTYVADYLFKEMASVEEAHEYRLQILRDYTTLVPPDKDFPLAQFSARSSPVSRAIGYGKGAMLFHMVRQSIGDVAFWQGLRNVYEQKRFKEASWDDFAAAFEKASGRDMSAFFSQWVKRAGAPTLTLEVVDTSGRDGEKWTVAGEISQAEPYYNIEVPVRLETDSSPKDSEIKVSMNGPKTAFTIQSDAPPKRILVDPENNIFRRLYPSEIPPTVNEVRAASDSLQVIAARNISSDTLNACKVLLTSLGLEKISIIQEGNGEPDVRTGESDLLYLGFPEGRITSSELPKGLWLGQNSFTVDQTTYASPGDALFVVLPQRNGKHRFVAVFHPLSAGAAQAAARKIAHYGKYSSLVFHDGTNVAKRTWPVTSSPLIHEITVKEASP